MFRIYEDHETFRPIEPKSQGGQRWRSWYYSTISGQWKWSPKFVS